MPKKGDRHRSPRPETMKCVKRRDGVVKRIRNEAANAMVATGDYKFVPKNEWKAQEQKKAA